MCTVDGDGVVLIILRIETSGLILNSKALLEGDTLNVTLFIAKDFLRTPSALDQNAIFLSFSDFVIRCRHDVTGLEADLGYMACTNTNCISGAVDCHVTTTDNYYVALDIILFVCIHFTKEVNCGYNTFAFFAGNTDLTTALATDCDIECLVALSTKLIEGDVLTNFNAGLELNAHFLHDIDFSLNNILLQLEGRNTVNKHTTTTLVLLEYGRGVTLFSEVVSTGETCRTTTDDSYLICREVTVNSGNNLLRDVTGLCVQIMHSDELLHFVDCDCFVDGTTGTSIFTTTVTDMSANCRKRIVLLNQSKCLGISAFCCHLQVTLNCNVCRTCSLTRSSTGTISLDTVVVSVIPIPVSLRPLMSSIGRKFMLRILNLSTILLAELLAKLNSTCRAELYATSASNTLVLIHFCHICRTGKVRGVEEEGGTKCVTYVNVTVTDSEDLVLTIDIGDLMNETILFCSLEDIKSLFSGDIFTTLVGLNDIISHVAYCDTPTIFNITATFIIGLTGTTAGARALCIFSIILIQPVRYLLNTDRLVVHLNCMLNGDNVHTDTSSSGRNDLGNLLQRKTSHMLEEVTQFRMLIDQILVHVRKLTGSGNEHRKNILLLMSIVLIVPLKKTGPGHMIQHLLKLALFYTGDLLNLSESLRLTNLLKYLKNKFSFFIGAETSYCPILRIILGDLLLTKLNRNSVRDEFSELNDRFSHGFGYISVIRTKRIMRISLNCHLYAFLS